METRAIDALLPSSHHMLWSANPHNRKVKESNKMAIIGTMTGKLCLFKPAPVIKCESGSRQDQVYRSFYKRLELGALQEITVQLF
jgi:hypothetical protein